MFESLQMAPPDAILGLTELFRKDPNPDKINVAMGVYRDESGSTPILASGCMAREGCWISLSSSRALKARPAPGKRSSCLLACGNTSHYGWTNCAWAER